MCAVFKFASNVEEFVIAMDCDKSELSIVLTCKDGEPAFSKNQYARPSLLFRAVAGQRLCSRCFYQHPLC